MNFAQSIINYANMGTCLSTFFKDLKFNSFNEYSYKEQLTQKNNKYKTNN